jgi:hypothetical protein
VTKGAKHMTKDTKGGTQYQIVKISKNKIILRPQKGYDYDSSVDPYFKKKTITCSLSSNCKFYYRNASFPWTKKGVGKYKRIKKSDVLEYMNDEDLGKISDCYFEDEKAYYYVGGYCGEIYIKNGKVVAVLTDDGD